MKVFSLNNLNDLDNGKAVLAINHALKSVAADLKDRPGDETKRVVTIEIAMVPKLEKDLATLEAIETTFQVKTKLPALRTETYKLGMAPNGSLLFSEYSPFDPRQEDLLPETNKAAGDDAGDAGSDVKST